MSRSNQVRSLINHFVGFNVIQSESSIQTQFVYLWFFWFNTVRLASIWWCYDDVTCERTLGEFYRGFFEPRVFYRVVYLIVSAIPTAILTISSCQRIMKPILVEKFCKMISSIDVESASLNKPLKLINIFIFSGTTCAAIFLPAMLFILWLKLKVEITFMYILMSALIVNHARMIFNSLSALYLLLYIVQDKFSAWSKRLIPQISNPYENITNILNDYNRHHIELVIANSILKNYVGIYALLALPLNCLLVVLLRNLVLNAIFAIIGYLLFVSSFLTFMYIVACTSSHFGTVHKSIRTRLLRVNDSSKMKLKLLNIIGKPANLLGISIFGLHTVTKLTFLKITLLTIRYTMLCYKQTSSYN